MYLAICTYDILASLRGLCKRLLSAYIWLEVYILIQFGC